MDEEKKYRKTVYWIFRHEQEEAGHGGGGGAGGGAGERVLLVADTAANLYTAWAGLGRDQDRSSMVAAFKGTMRKYERRLSNRHERCIVTLKMIEHKTIIIISGSCCFLTLTIDRGIGGNLCQISLEKHLKRAELQYTIHLSLYLFAQ